MGQRVTRNELAKAWGVGRSRVDNMVQAKQLTVGADGLIDIDKANAVRAKMDPARMEQGKNAKISKAGGTPPEEDDAPPGFSVVDGGKASSADTLYKIRTAEAAARTRLAQLKVQRELGQLVDRNEVKHEAHAAGRMLQQRLLALPVRVAPMVTGETDTAAVQLILDKEVKALLEEFLDALSKL